MAFGKDKIVRGGRKNGGNSILARYRGKSRY